MPLTRGRSVRLGGYLHRDSIEAAPSGAASNYVARFSADERSRAFAGATRGRISVYSRGVRFVEQRLPGVFLMELDLWSDERGFFARSFSEDELAQAGLHTHFPQGNVSWNAARHTLRGMHYQAAPNGEVKIVGCTAGAIFDVVVDLRTGSPTRFEWLAVELTAATGTQLYIPAGFAHGFLTLADATSISYRMGTNHVPDAA